MYKEIESNKRKSFILIVVFISFVVMLGMVLGTYFGDMFPITIIAVSISLIMSFIGFYNGDKVALSVSGAIPIQKNDNPYVYRMVENLCITAGLPMPKVYIIPSQALNAFATGRDPEHASIALTHGIIEALENEELEGVIAHELAHIKNYDIRLMMLSTVLIGMVAILSDILLRAHIFGGDRKNNNAIFIIIGIVLGILSPFIAQLIQLAISRKREYLADATGALLTRYPEGLARALEKISQSNTPLEKANSATAHLFISNPFKKKSFSSLFATHPPIEKRIQQLRNM